MNTRAKLFTGAAGFISLLLIVRLLLTTSSQSTNHSSEKLKSFEHNFFEQAFQKDDFTCGSDVWGHSYANFHRKALESSNKDTKYIVYSCRDHCEGLGDRLIGIVSSFYVALLMGRVFLIDSTIPVELESMLEPNMIDWRYKAQEHKLKSLSYAKEHLITLWDRRTYLEDEFTSKYTASVQHLKINQRLYLSMSQNANYKSKIKELGLDRMASFHIFGCLFHYLFKPSPVLSDFIREFQDSVFFNNLNQRTPVIGMQIRTGSGVGEHARIETEEIQKFWNCGKILLDKYPNSRILLTTDNRILKQQAATIFKDRVVIIDLPIGHVDKVGRGNHQALRNAIAELLLLSMCDHLIISRSNFGEVATMINFKPRFKLPQDQCEVHSTPKFEMDQPKQIHHEV